MQRLSDLTAVSLSLLLLACGDAPGSLGPETRILNVRHQALVLQPGDTVRLALTLEDGPAFYYYPAEMAGGWPSDLEIRWTSSNPSVASVDRAGLLNAHRAGRVRVQVDVDGIRKEIELGVQPVPGAAAVPFVSVALGLSHHCALSTQGRAYCWGSTAHGRLGEGAVDMYSNAASPRPVEQSVGFTDIATGQAHSCGLAADGAAFCWGRNDTGQLGDGTMISRANPTPVAGGLRFASLSAGALSTCALTMSGEAYCWGLNSAGELGIGSPGSLRDVHPQPRLVSGGRRFSSISAGAGYTCAVTQEGEGYCWGSNRSGELGTGSTTGSAVPARVQGTVHFQEIETGATHTCGFTPDGQVYCWGLNSNGELGTGTSGNATTPAKVAGSIKAASLAVGSDQTCAVGEGGTAYCWGSNARGQGGFGSGGALSHLVPTPIAGALRFNTLSTAGDHTCGATTSGEVYCWGFLRTGALGLGAPSYLPVLTPTRVVDPL